MRRQGKGKSKWRRGKAINIFRIQKQLTVGVKENVEAYDGFVDTYKDLLLRLSSPFHALDDVLNLDRQLAGSSSRSN
jgi:hypothetical protein